MYDKFFRISLYLCAYCICYSVFLCAEMHDCSSITSFVLFEVFAHIKTKWLILTFERKHRYYIVRVHKEKKTVDFFFYCTYLISVRILFVNILSSIFHLVSIHFYFVDAVRTKRKKSFMQSHTFITHQEERKKKKNRRSFFVHIFLCT